MNEVQKKRVFWISFPSLVAISLALIFLTLNPAAKEAIRALITSHSRVIVAKAEADLTGHGFRVAIIKVKTADTLALEIFETDGDDQKLQFVKRIVLPETRDAYFNFRGQTTNLVVTDIDGDGVLEILAPTFNESLVPRLNVYKYNPENKDFSRLGPETYRL